MSKKNVKMVLYAEPGVGKSTFVSKAPNPYFITTDGNFEWLDLPDENHTQVESWEEAKAAFTKIPDWAETVAVDLTEDLFKWCEYEYCKKNKLVHISEKGYGQGYDTTRNEFYIEISKLLGLPKNVVLIAHGISITQKDRRGVEFNKYVPSQRIPDKVWDMIEGRVRYFLRAFIRAEEDENGKLLKKRYLSLIPKENEFGIARGLDETTVPEDIPLDWDTFCNTIGANDTDTPAAAPVKPVKKTAAKIKAGELVKEEPATKVEVVEAVTIKAANTEKLVLNNTPVFEAKTAAEPKPVVEPKPTPVVETVKAAPVAKGAKPWLTADGKFIELSQEERALLSGSEKLEYIKAKIANQGK